MSDTYVPHEDDYPNDDNAPHGVNSEEEMEDGERDGFDDDAAS